MGIEDEHAVETFKSIQVISLAGLKLLALFNGGAVVALLAYLGNIAGKSIVVPDMRLPMRLYLLGLVACGLAFLAGYVTQSILYRESMGWTSRGRHVISQVAGILLALLSLLSFAVASYEAASRFPVASCIDGAV